MKIKTGMLTIPSPMLTIPSPLKIQELEDFLPYSDVCKYTIIAELFGGEFCINANCFVNIIIVIEEMLLNRGTVELKKTVKRTGNFCWICGPRDCKVFQS